MERSLKLAEEEMLEENSLENDRILKLQEELESEKHQKQELEDKLSHATAQLELLNRKFEGRNITYVTQESHVIRRNHQFLVENMKSSRLIDLLHEKNCITDEEVDHLNKQSFSLFRNDALLQWMRTIPFNEVKGEKILECFRQTKQNFVADLMEKGGALIKSKISTKLVKVGLISKSSIKYAEELKEKEAKVIEILNLLQGLSLSSIQNTTSEIADDDIVIAPYCHQESDGIVIWFWCQSINGQRNLQRMYESEILPERLITMFKQFSKDSASSASKLLVPTSINIFVGDFENGLSDKYQSDPDLINTIRTKAAEERCRGSDVNQSLQTIHTINGLTILDKELFVVNMGSPKVEVYDSINFSFIGQLNLKELRDPWDLGSCNNNKCLYIFDYKGIGQSKEILRVDPSGKLIKKWSTGDEYGHGLSVTAESNVILTVYNENKLNEYSQDGQLFREIYLSIEAGILSPFHGIKLSNGHFVISHGSHGDDLHRVCIVDADGTLRKSFGGKRGSTIGQTNEPVYLSVDGNGFVMVADQFNSRVLLLDSDLELKRDILQKEKHGIQGPTKILLDESNGRLFVADNKLDYHGGQILIFQFYS